MKTPATFIAVLFALLLCAPGRGLAEDASDAKKLIDQAEEADRGRAREVGPRRQAGRRVGA